jgi:putative tRNA adenosine deaminase-associated protein
MPDPDLGSRGADLALAAFRVAGAWDVQELTRHHLVDLETLVSALHRLPGEAGVLGIVVLDDDFVLVRVLGATTRVLLSDVAAVDDWDLAADVVDLLDDLDDLHADLGSGLDDDDLPPGDLDLLTDLGVSADDLLDLIDDDEAPLAELLSDLADQLGFGPEFDDAVGLEPV